MTQGYANISRLLCPAFFCALALRLHKHLRNKIKRPDLIRDPLHQHASNRSSWIMYPKYISPIITNHHMKTVLILSAMLLSLTCSAQDDRIYMRKVDSIHAKYGHEDIKEFRIKRKNIKGSYRFSRQARQLKSISVIEKQDRIHWLYRYHFIEGKLVMINKFNSYRSYYGDEIWASCYLKDGVVVYRKTNHIQIEDVDRHITRALELRSESPAY
jgi:hypothetical protein